MSIIKPNQINPNQIKSNQTKSNQTKSIKMNCVASTYNASGKLVGCTEQDLNAIISVQLYTVFALGTGLYICRSFTADNWADIAITLGWGCISVLTHTKRAFTRYALPCIAAGCKWASDACATEEDDDSEVSDGDHSCIRVVKDGIETTYSSIFSFVQDLDENFTGHNTCNSDLEDPDGDVINVHLSESVEDTENKTAENEAAENEAAENKTAENEHAENEDAENEDAENEDAENETDNESISELINRIENHTMEFDFILSEVCTLQTIMNMNMNALDTTCAKYEGMHVMKYDGFPIDPNDGVHFYDRKFAPVDHRMMEIVLQYNGTEYDLNLASPDNFYVAGNKLLDFAFLKWFMLKNHGVRLVPKQDGSCGTKCEYIIKCVDHEAVLHTLHPHNYLHVSILGFEVQDSGLI